MHEPEWEAMRLCLKRVAVGPEMSRDLTEDEAREAMRICLDRTASDVQIGVFLVAERMKRETFDENLGFLRALVDQTHVATAPCEEVAVIADPFDGFDRIPHFGPVVAATVAACGLPAVVLGTALMPPKNGVTPRAGLTAMGLAREVGGGRASVEAAAARAAERGVAYVDVEDFCPKLHALTPLRVEIAKRPALSTLEKLVTPIRGRALTHVVSGWVHSGYEAVMTALLERIGIGSALLLRGREGHVDAHPHRPTATFGYRPGEAPSGGEVDPKALGLDDREPGFHRATLEGTVASWNEALSGADGPAARTAAVTAAAILRHARPSMSLADAHAASAEALRSGRARETFASF